MIKNSPSLLQSSMKDVQVAVNHQVGVRFPALEPTKFCISCQTTRPLSGFYKNKTKKDGLQTHCIECEKNKITSLKCNQCNKDFHIKHRNIRKRKSFQCPDCVKNFRSERICKLNQSRRKDIVVSSKGYIYVSDSSEKHSYIFKHRKIMQSHIGRKLTKSEVVHHIDGNRLNNSISNLWLTDMASHRNAHHSLETLALYLYEHNLVGFDSDKGAYFLKNELAELISKRKST